MLRVVLYTFAGALVLIAGIITWYFATLYTPGPPQRGYLALTHATVLMGEELEPRTRATLLIRDGVIVSVTDDEQAAIPAEAQTIDLTGYIAMPGLIELDAWPSGVLSLLVERSIPLSPTLTASHAMLPAQFTRQIRQRLAEFHAAGGRIIAGSDAGVPVFASVQAFTAPCSFLWRAASRRARPSRPQQANQLEYCAMTASAASSLDAPPTS